VKLAITDIKVGKRRRKDMGDISALAASIEAVGLLHPVVVTADDYRLVAGERRLRAAKHLGWDLISVNIVKNLDDALPLLQAERDENTCRKDFLPEEAVALADAIAPIEERAARERQGTRTDKHSDKLSESQKAESRQRVASAVGMSHATLTKAREVVRAAESKPELRPLVDEMNRTGKVAGVHKKLTVMRQAEEIKAEPPPMPKGPFRVIVADPPWRYGRDDDPTHRSANPYPTMTLDAIKAMPVADIAAKDSVLWLWTTNGFLRESFEVLDAWGFTYKTCLTWAKHKIGTGDYLRGQTEHCLFAVKGRPTVLSGSQSTLLTANAGAHSAKPDEFYSAVESLCPGSKCELFSRKPRDGWTLFGNEIAKDTK